MIYQPKVLYNPKSEPVTFMCDHQSYVFKPGEKMLLDGPVAFHALRHANVGLREYAVDEEGNMPIVVGEIAYDKMPWKEMVATGSQRGAFKPGMKRKELTKALVELDEQEASAV